MIQTMSKIDPISLLRNAGLENLDEIYIRITDPSGKNQFKGKLPAKVEVFDENFFY